MVDLLPVRAWHPDTRVVDASTVVCPVYDTVSDADLETYRSSRFNASGFVPRPRGMPLNRFALESVGRLGEALRAGAFVQDTRPGLYVYGIRYRPPEDIREALEPERRRDEYLLLGLVGTLDLDGLGHGEVALHERTFTDRVEERVALADATGMSFAPIMLGYTAPGHSINNRVEDILGLDRRLLAFESTAPPLFTAQLGETTHVLWSIRDPSVVAELQRTLARTRLLVLDGHHRFTAAVRRHHEGRTTRPLVMLVEGGDRALQLLPWHRVVPSGLLESEVLVDAARSAFPDSSRLDPAATVEELCGRLHAMVREHRRGFIVVGARSSLEADIPPSSDVGADFDVLHRFLESDLQLDPESVEFQRSPRRAIEAARRGSGTESEGTAILLPGLTEAGVEERAFGTGRLMAHKSTMFLPKVAEGVVFAPADGVG